MYAGRIVEQGRAGDVDPRADASLHEGLLGSVPSRQRPRRAPDPDPRHDAVAAQPGRRAAVSARAARGPTPSARAARQLAMPHAASRGALLATAHCGGPA